MTGLGLLDNESGVTQSWASRSGAGEPVGQQELVTAAEDLGYDSVWTAESYGSAAVSLLAWLGARTTTLRLGTTLVQTSVRTPTALVGSRDKIADELTAWQDSVITTMMVSGDAATLRTLAELVP